MLGTLKSGYSFMEIVIVIAIISILAGVGIPSYLSYIESSKVTKTVAHINLVKNEINRYYGDIGRFPESLDDLLDAPDDDSPLAKKWNGPYLEIKGGGLPMDGWDRDLVYEKTPGSAHPYELYSFGKEGEDGPEEKRITAW